MTHRTVPVTGIYETMSRPIALSVARDIMEKLNVGNADVGTEPQIYFIRNGDTVPLPKSTMYDQGESLRLPADISLRLSLDENPTSWSSSTTKTAAADSKHIFMDIDNDVYVKPVYQTQEVKLNIKITGKNRQEVINYYQTLERQVHQSEMQHVHQIEYHYIIPQYVMLSLIDIHDKRNAVAGYGDALPGYLKDHFVETYAITTDTNANQIAFRIDETGIMIVGSFDFNDTPNEPEREGQVGEWSLSFNYKYYYDQVKYIHIRHPIVIHNQLLDKRFLEYNKVIGPENMIASGNTLMESVGSWRSNKHGEITNEGFIYRQPYIDTWHLHYNMATSDAIVSYLASIDDQLSLSCQLSDVEYFTIKDYLLRYMVATHDRLCSLDGSLVRVSVYDWHEMIELTECSVDQYLKVSTNKELSMRNQYHVVLSFCNTFNHLKSEHYSELMGHGCFFKNYCMIYYPEALPLFNRMDDCNIPPDDFWDIIDLITMRNQYRVPRTVNKLNIQGLLKQNPGVSS